MSENILRIQNVEKYYGSRNNLTKAIDDISFDVNKGEFVAIMGASGSGKTTLLNCISTIDKVTSGNIYVDGNNITQLKGSALNRFRRDKLGFIFQDFNLLDTLTAYENIALALSIRNDSPEVIDRAVKNVAEQLDITEILNKYPYQMSGGQKQRVAIARALVNSPKVLLLDEPLGALDLKLRKQMQVELKRLQKKLGITFVYVTHDQEEALTMSDRIAVMHQGHFEQIGTAKEIYENPQTKFVASFIGESNIFEANVDTIEGTDLGLTMENGKVRAKGEGFVKEEIVYISVRPENTHLSDKPVDGFTLKGIVKDQIYVGSVLKTIVELPNGKEVKVNNHPDATVYPDGTAVSVYWEPDKAVVIHTKEDKMYDAIEDAVLK